MPAAESGILSKGPALAIAMFMFARSLVVGEGLVGIPARHCASDSSAASPQAHSGSTAVELPRS